MSHQFTDTHYTHEHSYYNFERFVSTYVYHLLDKLKNSEDAKSMANAENSRLTGEFLKLLLNVTMSITKEIK